MGDRICQEARESSSEDRGSVEQVDAPLQFVSLVVHGDEVDASGNEGGLEKADEDSACYQAAEGLRDALADGDDAAGPDDSAEKDGGPAVFQDDVAGHFK